MFSSRSHPSKGPFRAIWIAAYFHTKLKKAQILQTDIVSTVDKMLQDDFGVISYRLLAYLLLGVVRIHSKKVGYMFDDCREVLNRINEFLSNKKASHTGTLCLPCNSITIPDRFELDAFDLDIPEDYSGSRSNVMPNEAITLKDNAWKNLAMVQFSLNQYQLEFDASSRDYCFLDDPPAEDVLSSRVMDNDMEAGISHNLSNLEASLEKLRDVRFCEEETLDFEKVYGIGEEAPVLVEPWDENHHTDEEEVSVSKMTDLEVQSHTEMSMGKLGDSVFSTEDCLNHEMFTGFHEKLPDNVKPFGRNGLNNEGERKIPEATLMVTGFHEKPPDLVDSIGEDHINSEGQINIPEVTLLESDMGQVTEDNTNTGNSPASMEKLQNIKFSREEFSKPEIFCRAEEELPETVRQHDEVKDHADSPQIKEKKMTSSDIRCLISTEDEPLSFTPDGTPTSKFPDPSGCTTPAVMVLPTPTPMEPIQKRKRICTIDDPITKKPIQKRKIKCIVDDPVAVKPIQKSKRRCIVDDPASMKPTQKSKRRCIIDDPVVLSNRVMKEGIEDPSDLVLKRSKVYDNAFATWKAYKISSLPYSFFEPLLNCLAVELGSLFRKKKLEIPESLEVVKATEELPESAGTTETVKASVKIPESAESVKPSDKIPESAESVEPSDKIPESAESVEPSNKIPESAETLGPSDKIPESAETVEAAEKVQDAVGTSDNPRQLTVAVSPLSGGSQIAPATPIRQASSARFMEETPIAPETPIRQTSSVRSIESPKESCSTNWGGQKPSTASLCEGAKSCTGAREDWEFGVNLMNEEISSRHEDNEECDVSPGRTRIARILKRRSEEETINLLQLLNGKTKKDSAQLFYEILVLRSKGYVDVEQGCAYGDILFRKLPKWKESDGARRKL